MKNATRNCFRLLIPVLIVVSIAIALMPARAFAGSVRLSKSEMKLYTNGGRKKIHLYLYDNGDKVKASWKSSKKSVATVTSEGVVKARRRGFAKITATYKGRKYTCKITVRRTSATYKKAIKAYNSFLMNPYVVYNNKGDRDQADNFCSIDLDKDGIPELLVNVIDEDGERHHVLYHFKNKKMTTGQILGRCSDFTWFSSKRVMYYTKTESDRTVFVYSRDNGTTLNAFGLIVRKGNKDTYYKSKGSTSEYGEKLSGLAFRNYVDHDVLNYCSSKPVTLYVNTPYNRYLYLD